MKNAIIIGILLFSSLGLFAQKGEIKIEQDAKLEEALEIYASHTTDREYYTIQVGFGSYQRAENLKSQVDVDFPGWNSKIIFDSPTYRVHVGRFKTKLEAERRFLEVRQKYPASLLLRPDKSLR
ncbi:MAG: SPOR domain-containing protein [Flavobacteriaceae bacterium]|nr:SPOR domain-containing protein [Flavobacteriaceae bacterium]MDH3796204.1 SPOR domain-containing protein [Flavobacteriaceae bacterium]